MGLTVRRGVPTDAESLAELATRAFRETFAVENTPDDVSLHVAQAYGISQQAAELVDPKIATLLAEVDGQLAGYAQLRSSAIPDCVTGEAPVELWRFYVLRQWYGQGVAQMLMERVEMEARKRRARTLWLGVWERNERAKAFYRKYGFTDVGAHVFMVGTDPQTDRIWVRSIPAESSVERSEATGADEAVPR